MGKHYFPKLFVKNTNGVLQEWEVYAYRDTYVITHGHVGGKLQVKEREVKAKNVGRKNETTSKEQALIEAERSWRKQLDKGYKPEDLTDEMYTEYLRYKKEIGSNVKTKKSGRNIAVDDFVEIHPLLASKIDPKKDLRDKYLHWEDGVYVQPKLDGVRCVAQWNGSEVILTSRNAKQFPHLSEIRESLEVIFQEHPDIIFDGEIYARNIKGISDLERFSIIAGSVSVGRSNPGEYEKYLSYFVFDIVDVNLTQEERFIKLEDIEFPEASSSSRDPKLVKVEFNEVQTWKEAKNLYNEYMAQGYEGIILRARDGMYKLGNKSVRSQYLVKYKEFIDDEVEVIDFTSGEGTEKGLVMWICEYVPKTGKMKGKPVKLSVRPRGSFKDRAYQYEHGEDYIGAQLTIRFQELSSDGVPRFPVGIAFRDYE